MLPTDVSWGLETFPMLVSKGDVGNVCDDEKPRSAPPAWRRSQARHPAPARSIGSSLAKDIPVSQSGTLQCLPERKALTGGNHQLRRFSWIHMSIWARPVRS